MKTAVHHPFSALLVVVVTLAGCASASVQPSRQTALSEPLVSSADPAGRMRGYQPNRRYQDVFEIDGRTEQRSIEYGFDYDRKVTVRKMFDPQGRLIEEVEEPATTLRASPVEEARLVELVRTHPQLGRKMTKPGLHIYAGGFVLLDAGHPHCGLHSRCIRVVVSREDGSVGHVYALVDLVTDRVVEPFHAPIQKGDHALQHPRSS